jgi:uncharacterized protein (DUF983 family)
MPPGMVRCRSCRTLLNPELEVDSVEVPDFVPLPEVAAMLDVQPEGVFCDCPDCGRELRIARKYLGSKVACKFCGFGFELDPRHPRVTGSPVYASCPGCRDELRFASKYLGTRVACKHCGAQLNILPLADS